MTEPSRVLLSAMPDAGPVIRGFVVRIVVAAVAAGLCVARIPLGLWLVVALAVVALAVIVPRSLAAWALLVGLGVDQLLGPPASAGLDFAVLLMGVHLLHVLAAQTVVIPGRALVQATALGRPLLRFAVIQVPVQVVALIVLTVFPAEDGALTGSVPALGLIGAVAAVALAVLLAVPLFQERARD